MAPQIHLLKEVFHPGESEKSLQGFFYVGAFPVLSRVTHQVNQFITNATAQKYISSLSIYISFNGLRLSLACSMSGGGVTYPEQRLEAH